MGLFATGRTYMQTTMDAEAVDISYIRGATTLAFAACPDGAAEAGLDSQGQVITFGDLAWNFALSELASLSPALPARGDKIQRVIGADTHQWRALAVAEGPVFDWLDNGRSRISVHTVYDGIVS